MPQTAIASEKASKPKNRKPTSQSEELLKLVENMIANEKGENIVTIPLAGKTSIADYMVIASGRSSRQISAMAEKLTEEIKHANFGTPKIEGKENADWILLDTGDVIIHLFRPEVREFYQLEKFWLGDPSAVS